MPVKRRNKVQQGGKGKFIFFILLIVFGGAIFLGGRDAPPPRQTVITPIEHPALSK